ncbi:IPT/TIG domain-containing protein [Streptomyces sp. NPDC058695]|uniref:IPT/TIG domain-containing protein n=1 Tax=Streptomyces sp. NPDC058695 TaxID=3346604 RepID=UPI0036603DCC
MPGAGYAHKATDGGDVLVAGHGFGPGTRVDFDGVPAARITVPSNGVLHAEPPSAAGPVRVTVTTHAGSATAVLS